MLKRTRITRSASKSNENLTQQEATRSATKSNENLTNQKVKTPEQPQDMRQSRPSTRSQTKPLSISDSHVEQHEEPQQHAPTDRHQSPKPLAHRTPRSATISYEEFCNGVHNYVEAQHGGPTEPLHETPENLQVVPMDLECTPQDLQVKPVKSSSKVTILGPSGKSNRSLTKPSHIWNLPEGHRVVVEFSSDLQPINYEGGLLKRFLGTALRKPNLIPINFKTWRKVPLTYKDGLWGIIKSKFEIPAAHEKAIKKILLQKVGYMWRGHKCNLKTRHFDEDKSMEEVIANVPPRVDQEQWASLVTLWNTKDMKTLSQVNKAICLGKKKRDISGTKRSLAKVAEETKEKDGAAPTLAELFISTRKRKAGTALKESSAKKIATMKKLLARHQKNPVSSNGGTGGRDDIGGSNDDANGRTVNNADVNSPAIGKEIVKEKRKARKSKRKGKEVMAITDQAEEDRRQAREDRKQAEEDRMQAREDRKQAEEDRRQAREDRKQAEEERRKAQEEGTKNDEEIRFLKERLAWMENLVSRLLPVTDVSTIPTEVPRLKGDPSNKAHMNSATSSHAHEHCSPDQDLN